MILSYFSPAKSPFYSVIAFGTIAILFSCERIDNFLAVAIPIYLVLVLSTGLSFRAAPSS